MKHIIGGLYLLTAAVGIYWSIYLTMTGVYGVPFSRWYAVMFIGGLVLLIGAIFWWASSREWTRWLPIIGSGMLAMYFLPAFIKNLPNYPEGIRRQPLDVLLAFVSVALVVTSLIVAIRNRHVSIMG